MLATAAADESLKFWKVFERKAGINASTTREGGVGKGGAMAKQMTIR
jgi:cell division cycle protein 20 (cofactor of APC complex)